MTGSEREIEATELLWTLEYADQRIADAERVIWDLRSKSLPTEVEQSLDDLLEELWAVQIRLEEFDDTVTEDHPAIGDHTGMVSEDSLTNLVDGRDRCGRRSD